MSTEPLSSAQSSPLAGLTVVDLTHALAGPFASFLLAGLGARVIKVENPDAPDPCRQNPPYLGPDGVTLCRKGEHDVSVSALNRLRGKYGITLNLKQPQAREVACPGAVVRRHRDIHRRDAEERRGTMALDGREHGLGLGASRAKFFYIPESHTDGVFAIIGEELGIVATVPIILLYMLLMVRGFQVARKAQDDFGRLIATGVTTWITVQALLNIGGITRVIPLTGVPLPFLSFGSNALAAVMLAMGVLISVSRYSTPTAAQADGAERQIVRRRR